MTIRERKEKWEEEFLAEWASKSHKTKGRGHAFTPCDIRTNYERDRDRVLHSKGFRRLMHKTQVFISPEGDHYRTRLTHTLEVMQVSDTIASALRLNRDLTEAIAYGHDLGHTPYGHTGEVALHELLSDIGGFRHNEQSVRMVDRIENNGKGLNLTWETVDGILNHRGALYPNTLEGKVVQAADKIAYINHDIDDAVRAGLLNPDDLPKESIKVLGGSTSERINTMVYDIVETSQDKPDVKASEERWQALMELRAFMFKTVYQSQLQQKERGKIKRMLGSLYDYYFENPAEMTSLYRRMLEEGEKKEIVVGDYIACMTDRYAMKCYKDIFLPTSWELNE